MKQNQIIGTDVSIDTCKKEGYLMIEQDGNFNPDKYYRVFSYLPDYAKQEWQKGNDVLLTDTTISAKEAIERYLKIKQSIDSFTGMSHETDKSKYDYYTLLYLADNINMYCGL